MQCRFYLKILIQLLIINAIKNIAPVIKASVGEIKAKIAVQKARITNTTATNDFDGCNLSTIGNCKLLKGIAMAQNAIAAIKNGGGICFETSR